jgi:hypothetical protein
MPRYRTYGGAEDGPAEDGDAGFVGVDERRDPRQLPAGLAARAVNKVFDGGVAETRRGIQTVRWGAELTVNFPIQFPPHRDLLDLFNANPDCFAELSFRVYGGTTLQLLCPAPQSWHAVWIEWDGAAYSLAVDQSGMASSDWVYADYDEATANFRLLNDTTLQVLCPATGLWHSIWIELLGGVALLAVDQVGMSGSAPSGWWNYLLLGDKTLQLMCPATLRYHSLWVEKLGGVYHLAIDATGNEEPNGFAFDQQAGFGKVYGELVFSDPNRQEGALLATRYGVIRLAENQKPQYIYPPGAERIDGRVVMVQAFDRVIMFRGAGKVPLVWNPAQDFETGLRAFETIEQTDSGDGTEAIPPSDEACLLGNRLYVALGRDQVAISDVLDYTRYDSTLAVFRINAGSDDAIVRLFAFNETTLLVFKDQSIHVVEGLYGEDLATTARQYVLSGEYGAVARGAVVQVGKDVFFLSERGVDSIGQALDNRLQAGAKPLSDPIKPVIDRINWAYAKTSGDQAGAVMEYHDNKLFLAVPLDGATFNNALLVFNFTTGAWEGYWTGEWMDVRGFVRTQSGGRRALFIVTGDAHADRKAHGALMKVGEGESDFCYDEEAEIEDELVTRGYLGAELEDKRFQRAKADVSTWRPVGNVFARLDGVAEEVRLSGPITRDRKRYTVWGHGLYDESNAGDNHGDPFREDYSVDLSTPIALGSGVNPMAEQRFSLSWKLNRVGQFCQIRFSSTQGRMTVRAVKVEALPGPRGYGGKS